MAAKLALRGGRVCREEEAFSSRAYSWDFEGGGPWGSGVGVVPAARHFGAKLLPAKLYGSMEPSEARELRQLREESTKLRRLVADLSLDKAMLQDVLEKNSEAGSQETDREVPYGSIFGWRETSVSVRSTASLGPVLPKSSRSADGFTAADTGSGAITRVRFGYRRILLL